MSLLAQVTINKHCGKALLVDPINAEDREVTFDDLWTAKWNEWTSKESTMQLAGHLRGRDLHCFT